MTTTPTGRLIKEPGHIARMYSSGPVQFENLPRDCVIFDEVSRVDWVKIESRAATYYGYDPYNHRGYRL